MAKRQPNILLFVSDQQRTDTMSCYGNDWIRSPNLDALAAGSYIFDNTYCTQSLCTPSRGSLMTGQYPHQHGCVINNIGLQAETETIAEMLPDNYHKAHFGKWHLGNDSIRQHGFDEWISVEDGHRSHYADADAPFSDLRQWLIEQGHSPTTGTGIPTEMHFGDTQRATLPAEHQMAAFLADHAGRFIRQTRDDPWLLVFSTFEPHPPYSGPHNDMYDASQLPVGPAFLRAPEGHSRLHQSRAEFFRTETVDGQDLSDEQGWRQLRAQYFANVKIIDDAMGRVLCAMEETGQAEQTLVAFTSDHGEMAGDHGMLEKRVLYEESARVPLLLRVPWLNDQQRRVRGVTSHVDLLPTLLDLAGHSVPETLPGRSLTTALTGAADLRKHDAFLQWNGVGAAQVGGYRHDAKEGVVRDRNLGSAAVNAASLHAWRSIVTGDRWKLNLCAQDDCELFDLANDPHELSNLFLHASQQDRVQSLTARIRQWQSATGDTVPLPAR